jgi:hypothetical protein
MYLRKDLKNYSGEIEKLSKRGQHHIGNDAKFLALKDEILNIMKTSFSETSRHYRIVQLTNSPATVLKVMNHIVARAESLSSAVNL